MRDFCFLAVWLSMAAAIAPSGWAASLYWDTNGPSAGAGGTSPVGTWDTTKTNWNATPDGTGATVPWTSGSNAIFAAGTDASGTYTVTLLGNQTLSGLAIEEGTVSVSGNTLTFGGAAPINISSGASFVQNTSNVFAGTGGLAKTGPGAVLLRST